MSLPPDLDPAELADAFERQALDTAVFGHEAHVAVAHAMLNRYDFLEATTRYAGAIRAMAARAGAPEKFNVTITFAFMSVIAERMAGHADGADYASFRRANPDLYAKGIIGARYSPGRLTGPLARAVFLLPDQ